MVISAFAAVPSPVRLIVFVFVLVFSPETHDDPRLESRHEPRQHHAVCHLVNR